MSVSVRFSLATSFLLTFLIFVLGILFNYYLDFYRISEIQDILSYYEIDTAAYYSEQDFFEQVGGSTCAALDRRIMNLKSEIRKVGSDLASYSSFSWFKKRDYDFLKRKYFLLQIQFFTLLKDLGSTCDTPYVPILFFYAIDDVVSERQGFVLEELSKEYQNVVVLSLDKDYEDEPLVSLLGLKYNITIAPSIVIDNLKKEGYSSIGELNASVRNLLYKVDPFAQDKNFLYVPEAAGLDLQSWMPVLLSQEHQNSSLFAKGDVLLTAGRMSQNKTTVCSSLKYYDQTIPATSEEQALIFETSASLGCGRNRKVFLQAAADVWQQQNKTWRAVLYRDIAQGKTPLLQFAHEEITSVLPNKTVKNVRIGSTAIVIHPEDTIVTQVDRVTRDWLGLQLNQSPSGPEILRSMSERLTYVPEELQEEIGWHEGGRLRNIRSLLNVSVIPATSTLAAEKEGHWYASDENGTFRFEVPLDKVLYPTTRFLRGDLAVLVDTHGVNMLVDQAISKHADVVLSDCDHPGKVLAAAYLSRKGISVICYPDKFVPLAIGHKLKLVGSPPLNDDNQTLTIGGRPLRITIKDRVVVVNATSLPYALWYYQTPASYFSTIAQVIPLNMTYYTMSSFGEQKNVTALAERINATVLATRVFSMQDYAAVQQWLAKDSKRKAVLFHSASYPAGQRIFNEFPNQTTFDDPNPLFW